MRAAGAAWRGAVHPAVQLPGQPGGVQDWARPDGRQHRGHQAAHTGRRVWRPHDSGASSRMYVDFNDDSWSSNRVPTSLLSLDLA